MCGFIEFVLNNENLVDFTSLFSPNNFKEDDKKILE